MVYPIKTLQIEADQRSEIVFALAHHCSVSLRIVVADQHQKKFYEDSLLNINFPNLQVSSFSEFLNQQNKEEWVVFLDVPATFQVFEKLVAKTSSNKQTAILILLKINKKYLNMVQKHISLKVEPMEFSANKFLGINDKLRTLVESNYEFNRTAFYAYGAYLNNFRANLLKKIFNTNQVDVTKLAGSFGFTTAPRVKEGSFLNAKARELKKRQLLMEKRKKKKQEVLKQVQGPATKQVQKKVRKTKQIIKKGAK